MSICQVSLNYMSSTQITSFFRSMRGFSISSTMETIAPDFPSQCPSDNVSIAGSLASEVTRNAANTMSTIAKMNQFHLGNSSFNFRFKIQHFWTIHRIEYDLSLILCLSRIVLIQTIDDCVLGG